jgi:hypothetical protein
VDEKPGPELRDEPLVTIAEFETAFEASLARGALEAIGIRALVPGEELGSFSTRYGGMAGTGLQVFASDVVRANEELRRMQIRLVPSSPEE